MDIESGYEVHASNSNTWISYSSSSGSSRRKNSLRSSAAGSFRVNDDAECDKVSEAGDIGDVGLQNRWTCEARGNRNLFDEAIENEAVYLDLEHKMLESNGMCRCTSASANTSSSVSPIPREMMSPLSTDGLMKETSETDQILVLSPLFDYISSLLYLSLFGILGVLTRYLLKKLFGPDVAGVTGDHSQLYPDLPSNMVGSFLMGWWGVVFKGDIVKTSDHLAIGITTGYLGSLTTFSGWNQKMVDLSLEGKWVFSLLGFLLGLFLAAYSISFGVGTAKCFESLLNLRSKEAPLLNWRINTAKRHCLVTSFLVILLFSLLAACGVLVKNEFHHNNNGAELWIACLVAAPGVWIRWFLARLNGRGMGKSNILKWMPFGTLLANVIASSIMAAISTSKRLLPSENSDTILSGIQLGFLGALSTVSTFIAEYHAMENCQKNWRAYAYALLTILLSYGFGILIYYVPLRIKGY